MPRTSSPRTVPFALAALLLAPAAAALDAPALPASAIPDAARTAGPQTAPPGLDAAFQALQGLFADKRVTAAEGNSVVPAAERMQMVGSARTRFHGQLAAMLAAEPEDGPALAPVRSEGDALLSELDRLMARGEIDPRAGLRASAEDPPAAAQPRELRIGVYPVAADPFQWAHILIGLRAMAAFRLDKVVFILAGDDPRKPDMTKAGLRHTMGRAVLDQFAPFFTYSPLAVGATSDGETNIFRLLALNKSQRLKAFYLAGGEHYRLKDKNGNDDTLPRLERLLREPASLHTPGSHSLEVAFISREGMDGHVPTSLDVHILPNMSFEASSSMARGGRHALMPFAAYDYVLRHRPGLYGIGSPK